MNKNINQIFSALLKEIPNPKCELEYVNDYTFLVAILLSAQTTDKNVNRATKELFNKVKTPAEMIALGIDGIKEYIKSIGLYNNKAKYVMEMSIDLQNNYGGIIPLDFDALVKLKGVGKKTAKVFLNSLYNQPLIAVDTHVFRVANRLGIAVGKDVATVERELDKNVPFQYKNIASHLLVLHGRYVCTARKPNCEKCVISAYCPSSLKE